ncbi:TSUP family transporter [Halotalea alkalilenta]|uniref:Probable membrane transporter protein n=1 Tax=Halotalea alkalilenta TaxID=376489 RepID=A0A172YBB7_9GAMM|nr:TSUP family transporter [Halotalea alkalilenta]ANF56539.1 hypothetical protein A5892_02850 [Halotalea alkalilenta]
MTGWPLLLMLIVAVFFTSLLSGVFGMVGGLLLLGALLVILPPATAIAVQGVLQICANASRAWFSRDFIDWRILAISCLGLGLAAGALALVDYTPSLVTITLVIGLMPIMVWLPRRWLALDASRPSHALISGALSGGLNLAVGVSGPTTDIFFIRTRMDRRTVIATKAAIQVASHAVKVLFYWRSTLHLGGAEWAMVLVSAPFALFGTRAGNFILVRLTDANFRRWTRWLVTAVGGFYLAKGIWLLVQ